MNKILIWKKFFITFAIPLLIITSMILLVKSSLFMLNPNALSIGIIFDLLLTVPLIYFFLIRKREIPKTTVVLFFVGGIYIASTIIPKEFQFYLPQIKTWVLPVLETTILIFIILKIRKTIKRYKIQKGLTPDFFTAVKNISKEILPSKAAITFATEIAVFYYGFFSWKKRKLRKDEFSYHRDSGTVAVLFVFIFIILVETSVIHILLLRWSPIAAWILSIISCYSAILVFGIARSMSKRPIAIEEGELKLRYGLLSESTIKLENVASIELSTNPIEFDNETRKLSPLGEFESHNVVVQLKNENTLIGLYGFKKRYKTIALHIDKKEQFKTRLENAL